MVASIDELPKPQGRAEVWRERVAAQQASGLSIRSWCAANDCRVHTFYWWRIRLGLRPGSRQASSPGFSRVVLRPSAGTLDAIRLKLAGGRELLLPVDMSAARLAELIHAIEGTS